MQVGWLVAILGVAACSGGHGGHAAAPRARAHTDAPVVVAPGRSEPVHLVADASGLYWTEHAPDNMDSSSVWYLPAGAAAPRAVWTFEGSVTGLGIDGDAIYVGAYANDAHPIWRRAKQGGAVTTLAADAVAEHFAFAGDEVFVAGGSAVQRLDRKGTRPPVTLVDNAEYSYMDAFAVGEHYVFLSNSLDDTPRRIYRVARTGGEASQLALPGVVDGWTLAGDALYVSVEPDRDMFTVREADASATATPLHARGTPIAALASTLLVEVGGEGGAVYKQRSLADGTLSAPLPLGDVESKPVVGDGAVWFTRGTDILMYVP